MDDGFELVVGDVDFGEGPRWRDGRLWYSDFYQRAIYAVSPDGNREAIHADLDDRPSGLGWLPDGSLLVVAMTTRRLLREQGGALVHHADLSSVASGNCNDMVVSGTGDAYVGNFGFDFEAGETLAPADLALVRPDGTVSVAATGLAFPNGMVITPDGTTLVVGETFGARYQAFTIGGDATLSDQRTWAEVPGTAPDGCTLDAEGGIWFADALGSQVVRVREGGEVTHTLPTPMPVFACMLGGDDGRTLYALCAPSSTPAEVAGRGAGAIYALDVDIAHAGLP